MFKKERVILELMAQEPSREWYGLELIEASNKKLRRGTIYVHLESLEDLRYISSRLENDEEYRPRHPSIRRRRLYKITELGLQQVAAPQ